MNFNSLEDRNVDISENPNKLQEKYNSNEQTKPEIDKNEIISLDTKNTQPNEKENKNSQENDNSKEELNREESEYSTLDESIYKTFQRDLLRIFHKIKHVAIPTFKSNKSEELQNWDLWGPLLICLVLCM